MQKRELVIIGAGPAGLSAAIYGRRAGLDVLVLEHNAPGGQIRNTDEIENMPGVLKAKGLDLAESFQQHAEHFKAEILSTDVNELKIDGERKIVLTSQEEIEAKAVIIASGASHKELGVPGEIRFKGAGVSYCAVCDANFFVNEVVAVIGGGNTAVEEANYLTQFAQKVYIIHRRDSFRADRLAVDRLMNNPKIQPMLNTEVEEIEGSNLVESLKIKDLKSGQISTLEATGVFIYVGTSPHLEFIKNLKDSQGQDLIKLNKGWVATGKHLETSLPGVFAAGDVRDTPLRQVVTAAADGAVAAISAYHYIESGGAALELERK